MLTGWKDRGRQAKAITFTPDTEIQRMCPARLLGKMEGQSQQNRKGREGESTMEGHPLVRGEPTEE